MDRMNSPQIYKLLLENIFEEPTAKPKINCNNSELKEMCSNIYKTSIAQCRLKMDIMYVNYVRQYILFCLFSFFLENKNY